MLRSIGRRWPQRIAPVSLLLALLLLEGCSHILVHDERGDKQAQETKQLVAEGRIGDTVAALGKSFGEVAALQETRARDRAAYLFDWS